MTELYDPFCHELHEDPYPVYRVLRDEHPLYWCEARRCWALTRFDDVWEAVHDPTTYCSGKGIFPGMGGDVAQEEMLPVLIVMDPPRHTQLRSLVNKAFSPRRILDREPAIRSVAHALVAELADRETVDVVEDLAKPLPSIVIADLLGVPVADRREFRHWSDQIVQDHPDDPAAAAAAMEGLAGLYSYFEGLIAERRRHPRHDMLSALIEAEIDGQHLGEQELLGMCILLLIAGNETTTNLVSNAVLLLAQHPAERRRLLDDPSLVVSATEECLRFDSPVQALARTLTTDVDLHGTTVPAGDRILLVYGSANRDEREFPGPDTFDVGRRVERQLAFGHGIHFCLGSALARLEGRLALSELLALSPEWELDGEPVRLHSGPIRGLLRLPVSLRPAA